MGSPSDSEEARRTQIPRIDFRGLDLARASSPEWAAARSEAAAALRAHRCFEAVYGGVGADLKGRLMDRAAPELFALPLEAKARNASDRLGYLGYLGYIGNIPGVAYESIRVAGAPDLPSVDKFVRLLWPQGNPSFCNTVWTYGKRMQELEQMVERMILESLGLEKYLQSHVESLEYSVRLSEYGVPLDRERKIALKPHVDPTMITIIAQHEVGGLEVQAEDGSWIAIEASPSPDSFVVMTGEAFAVGTNGRLAPCHHRVRITCEKKRYSALFGSRPKKGCVVQVPEELVDEEHPLLYRPCDYSEYIEFRFSEEGKKVEDTLTAFCGVAKEEIAT